MNLPLRRELIHFIELQKDSETQQKLKTRHCNKRASSIFQGKKLQLIFEQHGWVVQPFAINNSNITWFYSRPFTCSNSTNCKSKVVFLVHHWKIMIENWEILCVFLSVVVEFMDVKGWLYILFFLSPHISRSCNLNSCSFRVNCRSNRAHMDVSRFHAQSPGRTSTRYLQFVSSIFNQDTIYIYSNYLASIQNNRYWTTICARTVLSIRDKIGMHRYCSVGC